MTLKIGLTGGIGSGKTTVSKIFASLEVPVFNADREAKKLINQNLFIKNKIISTFGKNAFTGEKYNPGFVANSVFNNRELLAELNHIVHPFVMDAFISWSKNQTRVPYLIMEAAVLFESGLQIYFDHTILVRAPEDIRVNRIMKRDKISRENIKARMSMQLAEDEAQKTADYIIINDGVELLIPQVLEIHHKFVSLYKM